MPELPGKVPEGLQALKEEMGRRLWSNEPPEIQRTMERLEATGYSRARAEEKITRALAKTYFAMADASPPKKMFDVAHFKAQLGQLE